MNISYLKKLKRSIILSFTLLAFVSCQQEEIEGLGVDLVNQQKINSNSIQKEIEATTNNVEKVMASGASVTQYLLGVYSKNSFGTLQGDLVSQLTLPATGSSYSYGKTPIIDSVLVTIPYQATAQEKYSNGKPQYKLDSIFGNSENAFKISVYELKTFLNTLNPNAPSKTMIYESNKTFAKGNIPFYSGSFKVNKNDTVAYIKRYDASKKQYKTDTIKEGKASPFISIPLDKELIKQKLIDEANKSYFASQDNFNHYFRGLYIAADVLSYKDSHIAGLTFSGAKMRIFYSNLVDESDSQDLNGNGTKGEKDVRIAKTYTFPLGGVKSNVYRRDNTGAFNNNKRLYIQGASGVDVITDVFANLNINDLRKSPRLITQANLTFYVDATASSKELPEQLFIYKKEDSEKLIDILYTGKLTSIGGSLEKSDEGTPNKYVFKMTRHIADLLKTNSTKTPSKLIIRPYNPTDIINTSSKNVPNYNWNIKGVVLHGTNSEIEAKRPIFEISYSKLNN